MQREDCGPGESDIVFTYESLQWGDGRAGSSDGSGRPGASFELRGPGYAGEHLHSSPTGLARTSTNSDVVGRHVFRTPTEEPAEPPERVCSSSTRGGNTDICSVTPQGTGTRRLTSDPAPDTVPDLSPPDGPDDDGDGVPDSGSDIVISFPWSENIQSSTDLPGSESTPAYSPNDELIALTSQQGTRIDVVVRDSDYEGDPALTTLTPPSMAGFDPTSSPDGSRIVFTGVRDGDVDLWSVTPEGQDLQRLTTHPAVDATADHSPDGSRIVFSSTRTGGVTCTRWSPTAPTSCA